MIKHLALTACLLACGVDVNAKTITDKVQVTNCRVKDGDTVACDLPCYLSWRCNDVAIRIRGIDTPETGHRAKCETENVNGIKAKMWLYSLVLMSESTHITNIKPVGAFGRVEADFLVNGKSVAPVLINNGLAVVSKGKRTKDWCDQ